MKFVKPLSWVLLALYLAILIWLVLFKFSFNSSTIFDQRPGSLNLVPFGASAGLREMFLNCVFFIPFGLLLSVNVKAAAFVRRLTLIATFSLVAEVTQYVFTLGAADITDLLLNTLGGFVGLAAHAACKRCVDSERLDLAITAGAGVLLLLFLANAVGLMLHRSS